MSVTCVLFDFDGVIADTERHNAEYLAAVLKMHGVILSDEDRSDLVGRNDDELRRRLISRATDGLTLEQLAQERKIHGNYYENGASLAPMPGVRELLAKLREAGIKTGVVSSTSTRLIITALNRMNMMDLFQVIVCGDMVAHTKPFPDSYCRAMELLNVTPDECIVIEDSPIGIRAAHSAGIRVIAYKGAEIPQQTEAAEYQAFSFAECGVLLHQLRMPERIE